MKEAESVGSRRTFPVSKDHLLAFSQKPRALVDKKKTSVLVH